MKEGLRALLILTLLATASENCRLASAQAVDEPETYILPILRFGPNNQKRDLRYFLALAKQLDAGIIPVGIYKHFLDRFTKKPALHVLTASHERERQEKAKASRANPARRKLAANETDHDCSGTMSSMDSSRQLLMAPGQSVEELIKEQLEAQKQQDALATLLEATSVKGSKSRLPTVAETDLKVIGTAQDLPLCLRNRLPLYMESDELFDWTEASQWLPMASVEELKAKGWNGEVDTLIHSTNPKGGAPPTKFFKFVNQSLAGAGATLSPHVNFIHQEPDLNCNPELIAQTKAQTKGIRVVAVMHVFLTYWTNVLFGKGFETEPPAEQCQRDIYEANRLMRPSKWLQDIADEFVKARFGNEPFIAVHVRPYPDKCIVEWMKPDEPLNRQKLKRGCYAKHYEMDITLSRCVANAVRAAGTKNIFVMSHPEIRKRLTKLFADADAGTPAFMNMEDLQKQAHCTDVGATFLSMVEDAIAVHPQAHTFLGTAMSSVTESIVYTRLGMGNARNSFLDKGKC